MKANGTKGLPNLTKLTSMINHLLWPRRLRALHVALGALLFMLCGSALAQDATAASTGPTVSTDQSDYPPGSTAYISGTGFAAGETVTCPALHADAPIDE